MPRVASFRDVPNVQDQGITGARVRAADFGKEAVGQGITNLGKGLGQVADVVDQIEDLNAKTEAARLTVEHTKLVSQLNATVRQAQGENASGAVEQAAKQVTDWTGKTLSTASPRARRILEQELGLRNATQTDTWNTYAFDQHKTAFKANTDAANKADLEAAVAEPDEAKAVSTYVAAIGERIDEQGRFFGLGAEQVKAAKRGVQSAFFKGRALGKAANGDPIGALLYANTHKNDMDESDYQDIVRSYRGEAVKQSATARVLGLPDPSGSLFAPQSKPSETPDPYYSPTGGPEPAPMKAADHKAVWANVIRPNEGSARVKDSNGHWAQYGINGEWHPEVDRGPITEARAMQIYHDEYWVPSGADKLPAALAALHADTFYLNQKKAASILRQSGGDYDTYMRLRKEWMAAILPGMKARSGNDYTRSYEQRNRNVDTFAALAGGKRYSFEGKIDAHTDMERVQSEVMADPTVPLDYKLAVVEAARARRADLKQEQTNREDYAHDQAIRQATDLGDGFTSITQLDPAAVASLSPNDLSSLTTLAKNNSERKTKADLDPYINGIELMNPKRFMSKEFVNELIKKGATTAMVTDVRNRQIQKFKEINEKKPDPLSSDQVWAIAKPVFEARGLLLDTVEDKGKKREEAAKDNQRKLLAINYLRNRAVEWAANNPGKKPPEEEVRKWVGASLLQVGGEGQRLFEADDASIYRNTPEATRRQIILSLRRLRSISDTTPSAEVRRMVADTVRKGWALQGYHGAGR